ncbi:Pam3-gp28 family putative phage holin [Shinella zoogloeoides]
MTVWLRILLYVVAGWLYGSGYIGDEVKEFLTTDPAVAASIEAGISAAIASVPIAWWQWAKRKGWAT